ncbi:MAG: hypothetical protein QXV01_07590, partial [Candidatus Bathyarchaeia archaeon]
GKVGVSLHLWVPLDLAEAAKRLCVSRGTSLSAVVTEFLKRWVGEAGEAGEWAEDYEFLKREYRRLFREFERLHAQMRKEDPEDELLNLAVEQGLDTEKLANMDEVVAKPDQFSNSFTVNPVALNPCLRYIPRLLRMGNLNSKALFTKARYKGAHGSIRHGVLVEQK